GPMNRQTPVCRSAGIDTSAYSFSCGAIIPPRYTPVVPLQAGARVGPYEITGQLGAGGMGEACRARDTKLGRDVALKVLPDAFANDPDRMSRFQREAQLLAALNHP